MFAINFAMFTVRINLRRKIKQTLQQTEMRRKTSAQTHHVNTFFHNGNVMVLESVRRVQMYTFFSPFCAFFCISRKIFSVQWMFLLIVRLPHREWRIFQAVVAGFVLLIFFSFLFYPTLFCLHHSFSMQKLLVFSIRSHLLRFDSNRLLMRFVFFFNCIVFVLL